MSFLNFFKKKEEPVKKECIVKKFKTKFFLEPSTTYIVKEAKAEKSFRIFNDHVRAGKAGLIITRINPNRIKNVYKDSKVKVVWLTELNEDNCIAPTPMEEITYLIKEFLEKSGCSVVLLDGIEYLIYHNTFEKVLLFLQNLKDLISISNSNLLIPSNKEIIKKQEIELLDREFEVYEE